MLKAKNRQQQDMVVSPTAEEAFTAIMRQGLTSYKQLPINCYQINTKYRDEIRPRYGVMRGREFNMMDGYTFNPGKGGHRRNGRLRFRRIHGRKPHRR